MVRTHDWSTIRVEGKADAPRISLYQKFGPYAEGDTIQLAEGEYTISKIGPEFTKRNGGTMVELYLKANA